MADFVPNQGEEEMMNVLLGKIAQPTLYLGLMSNTPAAVDALGDTMLWSNVTQATGFVGGNEKTFVPATWTVPTGAQSGQAATYPQQEFVADTGGASDVSGYYIRSSNNKLWVVGVNAEVAASGILKTMLAGAKYRVNPSLDGT
jgi:hypothetical protein